LSTTNSVVVKPLGKKDIDNKMMAYLNAFAPYHLLNPGVLNVEMLVDVLLLKSHGFCVDITDNIANNAEAETLPLEDKILMRSQVHDGICNRDPHDLYTGCHEAAHVILHVNQIKNWGPEDFLNAVSLSRKKLPVYYSSEWQAYYAAGALLMPLISFIPFTQNLIKSKATKNEIANEIIDAYGVSYTSAVKRLEKLNFFK
jgi:hypothetical protein